MHIYWTLLHQRKSPMQILQCIIAAPRTTLPQPAAAPAGLAISRPATITGTRRRTRDIADRDRSTSRSGATRRCSPAGRLPVAALLVAAGRGLRAGGEAPKQYRLIGGRSVLGHALMPFLAEPAVSRISVVIGEGDEARYADAIAGLDSGRLASPTLGGLTRQDSVRLGLLALAASGFDGIVLVHDAARPFVSTAQIGAAIGALGETEIAAIPALPVTDTIKRTDASGRIADTPRARPPGQRADAAGLSLPAAAGGP